MVGAVWTFAVVAMMMLVLAVNGIFPAGTGMALACTCAGFAVLLAVGYAAAVRRRLTIYFYGLHCGDVEAARSPLLFWGMLLAMLLFGLFFFVGGLSYLLGENTWRVFLNILRHS